MDLPMWEGDKVFLKKMLAESEQPFSIVLHYDGSGNLTEVREEEE